MAEPAVTEVFGAGAFDDASALTITKLDMSNIGLTNTTNNKAEGMLVAILLRASNVLTDANRLTDLVNRNVTINYSGQDLVDQGGGNVFLRDTYQISLYKPTTVAPIDPDNY